MATAPQHQEQIGMKGMIRIFAAALVLCFLAVLWPYLSTSKRVFGQYFYNVNSTFYMWYDEWGDAIKGTRAHGDRVGWPRLPADRIPGPAKYWREHSLQEIGARLAGGFRQMAIDLWSGFWALKFALLSTGFAAAAVWPRRAAIPALVRRHWPVVAFAATGNMLPDFPLVNKSFELCYACADR